MRLAAWGPLAAILLFGVAAAANVTPTASDLDVTTWERNGVTFSVVVEDADIDTADPDHDRISFSVTEPPAHGVVTADFDGVLYEQGGARLVMSYVPARTFTGTDRFVVVATDSAGESARVLVTVSVQSINDAGTLAGDVLMTTTFDELQTASLTVSHSFSANVVYRITGVQFDAGFSIKQDTAADQAFDDLRFSLRFPIDAIGSFYTKLDFDPNTTTPFFESGTASLTLSIGGLSTAATLRTDGTQTGSSIALSASGTLDGISGATLSTALMLNTCSPVFSSGSVSLTFANLSALCLDTCDDVRVSFTTSFDCSGFTGFNITASNVGLPEFFPYASELSGTVSVNYTLQTEAKTVSFDLGLSSLVMDCFSVSTALTATSSGLPGFSGIEIRAFHLDCVLPNGIRFESDSSLDPDDLALNNSVTGHSDYWERDRLSGRFDVCNGIGGDWALSIYFERPLPGVSSLFSWGMGTFEVDVYCNQTWRFFGMATIRSTHDHDDDPVTPMVNPFGSPIWELLVGFSTRW